MRWRVERGAAEEAAPDGGRPAARRPERRRVGARVAGLIAWLTPLTGFGAGCVSLEDSMAELRRAHRPADARQAEDALRLDTHFDSPGHRAAGAERLRDPLGHCLEHTLRIANADAGDPRVRAQQIRAFAWLLEACTHSLTRERAIRELGRIARQLGITSLEESSEAGGSEANVTEAAHLELGFWLAKLPELEGADLATAAEALHRVRPAGLSRAENEALLEACLARSEAHTPGALVALRDDAARRVLVEALRGAVQDPHPRVRAQALRSWGWLGPEAKSAAVRAALAEPSLESIRAAADLLGAGEVPPVPEGAGSGSSDSVPAADAYWMARLIEVLAQIPSGQVSVAICKALSHVTGRPRELHPEQWLLWWDEQGSTLAPDPR